MSLNLRQSYAQSEEQIRRYFWVIALGLIAGMFGVVFLSPIKMLGLVVAVFFFLLAVYRPWWALVFLCVYLPFEPFILKWIPDDIYLFARFFSEGMLYLLLVVAGVKAFVKEEKILNTPIAFPLALFMVVLVASAIFNLSNPMTAAFGMRNILRFITVFFAVILLKPNKGQIRRLTMILLAVVAMEATIGITQALIGGSLDAFLLPSETRNVGEFTVTEGTAQFWDPGSRVFATMGRYDRLGTFLGFFLVLAVGFLYEKRAEASRFELWWLFLLGLPALALTYSRSSWFGFVLGFLFIALWVKRDRRVWVGIGVTAAIIGGYMLYSGIVVSRLIDVADQPFIERFFEAFSMERWAGEYYGLGRLYWMVQTVTTVVPASPIFGWGPGSYGAGAVTLFHNTKVYDTLGLPFGVYGTEGYIDNNWFSLWGETGTLGFAFYLWMYLALFFYSLNLARQSYDPFTRALALGYSAAMIAVALNAFLATFLEVRTLAVYLWMYGGFIVVLGETSSWKVSDKTL